jgi:hypothetical protein
MQSLRRLVVPLRRARARGGRRGASFVRGCPCPHPGGGSHGPDRHGIPPERAELARTVPTSSRDRAGSHTGAGRLACRHRRHRAERPETAHRACPGR